MSGPCLCGDTYCPSCGEGCIKCDDAGKEKCDCSSMYDDKEHLEKMRKEAQEGEE